MAAQPPAPSSQTRGRRKPTDASKPRRKDKAKALGKKRVKSQPKTLEELQQWLHEILAEHPQGLTISMLVCMHFTSFQKPLKVDLPAVTRGEHPLAGGVEHEEHCKEMLGNFVRAHDQNNANQALQQMQAAAALNAAASVAAESAGMAAPEDHFVHTNTAPLPDALKLLLLSMPGVVFESHANKFILGDKYSLLRVHMNEMASRVAGGGEPNHGHWGQLFRKLDRDKSGKLNRKEFYAFVRDYCRLTDEDFSDETIFEVFMALDADQSGQISTEELIAFAMNEESVNAT